MTEKSLPRIPVNIIAGSLGAGKTTTINHLLKHRPEDERWAVLVNEYGLVGLDGALLESQAESGEGVGIDIREVAGGCICCSAGFMFQISLTLLLQRRPDRLLIEPTGLAALSGILDTLDRQGIREAVDVRSVICLLDPTRLEEVLSKEETQDQVQAADILLASRPDMATSKQLASFESWARTIFPPKKSIGQIERGELSLSLLDLVAHREATILRAGHHHGTDHDHHHDHQESGEMNEVPVSIPLCDASTPIVQLSHRSSQVSTVGWVCWNGITFDGERVLKWLQATAQLPGARRTKAVLKTSQGWQGYNFADGIEEVGPSAHRRDSRLEMVIEGGEYPDVDRLERSLRSCAEPPLAGLGV